MFSGVLWLPGSAQDTKNRDQEIEALVRKVGQYPGRDKYLMDLVDKYNQANAVDIEKINALRKTGQPDIWYEIYNIYFVLDQRQGLVFQIPENALKRSGLINVDYSKNLAESKHRALAYLNAHGEQLLGSDEQKAALKAYLEFMKAAGLDKSYPELDKNIRRAILKGATDVEFELQNFTGKEMSTSMAEQLTAIVWEFKKARYGQEKPEQRDMSLAFILRVNIENIEVGPDQFRELEYQEERDLYQDDVVIDTLKCLVREIRQLKKTRLSGSIEYVDRQIGRVVNRVPISVESVFSNAYATIQGDIDAAGEETRNLLKAGRAEYPDGAKMIDDATAEFVIKAREIILAE